jgi:hypothetical protein
VLSRHASPRTLSYAIRLTACVYSRIYIRMEKATSVLAEISAAVQALEESIYNTIARQVKSRGSPDSIARLTELLQAVRQLPLSRDVPLDFPELQGKPSEPTNGDESKATAEYSSSSESLIRRGHRQGGAGHYVQRVPWDTVAKAAAFVDAKCGTRTFHAEKISRELELPSYQTYAALNLWLTNGHIEAPKRGSYRKRRGADLATATTQLRESLPRFVEDSTPRS